MTAAITRYGITRTRNGTSLGTAARLLTLLLVCVLSAQAHTLVICCTTAPTHQHATSVGVAEPHTDNTGTAGTDGITSPCSDHEQHGDTCDIAVAPVRVTAYAPDAGILAALPHGEPARFHTPDLTRTMSAGGRATGTDLVPLRI